MTEEDYCKDVKQLWDNKADDFENIITFINKNGIKDDKLLKFIQLFHIYESDLIEWYLCCYNYN